MDTLLSKAVVNLVVIANFISSVDFNFFVANYIGCVRPQAKLTFIFIQLLVSMVTIFHFNFKLGVGRICDFALDSVININ